MRKERKIITQEECLKIGGHCFVEEGMIITTNSPIYHRHCKHCGYREEGQPRDSIEWYPVPESLQKYPGGGKLSMGTKK